MTILPPNSTVLERAFDAAFAQQIEAIPESIIYDQWHPQDCPAHLLGYLAWAVSVDDWNSNWDEATKRSVIAASLEVHRHKGTPSSIKRVLAALGVETEVIEYADSPQTMPPHSIKVTAYVINPLDGQTAVNSSALAAIVRNLEYAKPARTNIITNIGVAFKNILQIAAIGQITTLVRA